MDISGAIIDQYESALEMLKQAIVKCPAQRWDDAKGRKQFWLVAYHAIFYTHLYLSDNLGTFKPWEKYRKGLHRLGPAPDRAEVGEPYSREEMLEFLEFCRKTVVERVPAIDLETASGFDWLPFNKLELQLYNIRHLQHHTAELIEWLGAIAGIDVDWVGIAPTPAGT
jgi:hypothetical protein